MFGRRRYYDDSSDDYESDNDSEDDFLFSQFTNDILYRANGIYNNTYSSSAAASAVDDNALPTTSAFETCCDSPSCPSNIAMRRAHSLSQYMGSGSSSSKRSSSSSSGGGASCSTRTTTPTSMDNALNENGKRLLDRTEEMERSKRDEMLSREFDELQEQIINERVRKRSRLSQGLGYTIGDEEEQDDEISRLVFDHQPHNKGKQGKSIKNGGDDMVNSESENDEDHQRPLRGIPSEITEQVVRTYSLSTNFNEGLELIHCVKAMTMGLDGKLKADVNAPGVMPTLPKPVQIYLHFKRRFLVERNCSVCGSNTVLWCKHVVAVILKALRSPDQVLYLGAFDDMAKEAQKGNYLAEAINNISQGNTALIHQLMKELEKLKTEKKKAKEDLDSLSNHKTFAPFTTAKIPSNKLEQLLPIAATYSDKGHYINEKKIQEEIVAACLRAQTGSRGCDRYTCVCRCHGMYEYDSSDDEESCFQCRSSGNRGFNAVNDAVTMYRDAAIRMIERGGSDLEAGLRIIEAITAGLLSFDFSFSTSVTSTTMDQYDKLIESLSAIVRTVMLLPEDKLSNETRQHWKEILPNWSCIIQAMTNGKAKANFDAAADAASNGWHSETIKNVLEGKPVSNFSESKEIADVRLGILIQQKEIEKAMNYARAIDRTITGICLLLSERRTEEALNCAKNISNLNDLAIFIFAAVCYVELLLETEEDVLSETMIDFVAEVGNESNTTPKKAFEFFLGMPDRRSELVSKSQDRLTAVEKEAIDFLDKMISIVQDKLIPLSTEKKQIFMPITVESLKNKYGMLYYMFGLSNGSEMSLPLKTYVLATLYNLFSDRSRSFAPFTQKVCQSSDDGNLLIYIALFLLSTQSDDVEGAFSLGSEGLKNCSSVMLMKAFCSIMITKDEKYSEALCNLLSTRKCTDQNTVSIVGECASVFVRDSDKYRILRNTAQQTLQLTIAKRGSPMISTILECFRISWKLSVVDHSDVVNDALDMLLGELDLKADSKSDCGMYLRDNAFTILDVIIQLTDILEKHTSSKPLCRLCEFALDFLDAISVRKPSPDILTKSQTFVAHKPYMSCSCSDCRPVTIFLAQSEETTVVSVSKSQRLVCRHLLDLCRRTNEYVTAQYSETEGRVTLAKTKKYLEAVNVVKYEKRASEFIHVSNKVSNLLIRAIKQVRSTDTEGSSVCDFLLDRIENNNSENAVILVDILDYLFSINKYERGIQLATKLLTMPNDNSANNVKNIMVKLIGACEAQADILKQEGKTEEFESMRNQAIEFAKKSFLLQKTVADFDAIKKLYAHFDMIDDWNTKVRSELLIQFLNEVHPENITVHAYYMVPSTIEVSFELLIADSYLVKANEILQALITKHTRAFPDPGVPALFDIVFQLLAKYKIHEQLIHQIFEPTVKNYAKQLLPQLSIDSTPKYMKRLGGGNQPVDHITSDHFWVENASVNAFERIVIEKWCLAMCPEVALWFNLEKLSLWKPTIKLANYGRVVCLMLKVKKCMELCQKPEAEWTHYQSTFLSQIKTKKKLVSDIQRAVTDDSIYLVRIKDELLRKARERK